MATMWDGITAGLLAGAAGATAKNAVSYLDQAVQGDSPATSPHAATVRDTADASVDKTGQQVDAGRASALGPLGGLAIGAGVGAVAGVARSSNTTPNPVLAAVATGLAAMAVGDGLAVVSGAARRDWASPLNLVRDLASHLAYGAVTGYTLHRILDPHTPTAARLNPFRR